jgi:large subunit ribosomal protein L16
MQKGRMKATPNVGMKLLLVRLDLKALEQAIITGRQMEALVRLLRAYMKLEGQIWIRIVPDKPITKKLQKLEWVKGKGAVDIM